MNRIPRPCTGRIWRWLCRQMCCFGELLNSTTCRLGMALCRHGRLPTSTYVQPHHAIGQPLPDCVAGLRVYKGRAFLVLLTINLHVFPY